MRTACFDMFSGVSGDMVLGALVDCGFPVEKLTGVVSALGLEGVEIEVSREQSHGIQATRVKVLIHDHDSEEGHHHHDHHHHRGLSKINSMIDRSPLEAPVRELAKRIFLRLGQAESAVHGVDIEKIHFHEVGALDSIVDIVGAAAGIIHLGIERFYASPFRFGTGFVEFSHGRLALPVPAVARLTLGFPSERTPVQSELTTPTGAAIVTTLVRPEDCSPAGPLTFDTVGYGMGSRTLEDRPNLLRLYLGSQGSDREQAPGEVVMLECNLDDMNPEHYDYLMDRLFASGALDVFLAPVQMKKNRPAVWLHVLCREADLDAMSRTVLENSSTIGLRWSRFNRLTLERRMETVATPWGELRVKTVRLPGGARRAKPEYEDLRALAEKAGLPLVDLAARVQKYLND